MRKAIVTLVTLFALVMVMLSVSSITGYAVLLTSTAEAYFNENGKNVKDITLVLRLECVLNTEKGLCSFISNLAEEANWEKGNFIYYKFKAVEKESKDSVYLEFIEKENEVLWKKMSY